MKYTIAIEETIAKDLKVEANSTKEACEVAGQKYKSGEFVLDSGECQFRRITITGSNEETTE